MDNKNVTSSSSFVRADVPRSRNNDSHIIVGSSDENQLILNEAVSNIISSSSYDTSHIDADIEMSKSIDKTTIYIDDTEVNLDSCIAATPIVLHNPQNIEAHTPIQDHYHHNAWDVNMNWPKSSRRIRSSSLCDRTIASSSSSCDCSLGNKSNTSWSTQVLEQQPATGNVGIPRNISTLSLASSSSAASGCSTISSVCDDHMIEQQYLRQQALEQEDTERLVLIEQQPVQTHNPLFFSPRRRLNSAQYNNINNSSISRNLRTRINSDEPLRSVPIISPVSFGNLSDISVDERIQHYDIIDDELLETNFIPNVYRPDNENMVRRAHNSSRWNNKIRSMILSITAITGFTTCKEQQMKRNTQQRRYLLVLFLIATYTTFGLASPNIQEGILLTNANILIVDDVTTSSSLPIDSMVVSDQNIDKDIDDPRFVVIESPVTTSKHERSNESSNNVVAFSSSTTAHLRGSKADEATPPYIQQRGNGISTHLSFARGTSSILGPGQKSNSNIKNVNNYQPQKPLLVYRRREVQDFYHQPALSESYDVSTFYSWYLNCFVLSLIALYYGIRENKLICRALAHTTSGAYTIYR